MAAAVSVIFVLRPWINPSLFQTGLFLLGCLWIVAFAVRPLPFHVSYPMLPLAGAVLWGSIQFAANGTASPAETRAAILAWTGNLVAFALARQICASAPVRRRFLDTLLWFAFALTVLSTVLHFSGGPADSFGPFLNHDQFAAFIEMLLPLALLRSPVAAAAMYASAIASGSRAGVLLATAEILLLTALTAIGTRRAHARFWLLVPIFVAVVGIGGLWHRLQDPSPFQGRLAMLTGTVAMVVAKPWTGFGLGTFPTTYPAYSTFDFGAVVNHAHNDWAEWAADGGIPFSLLIASIALWTARQSRRNLWGIGLVAVFVHSLVDFPLQKPALEFWLFALLGALASPALSEDPN
jgi:O-antigen ligase